MASKKRMRPAGGVKRRVKSGQTTPVAPESLLPTEEPARLSSVLSRDNNAARFLNQKFSGSELILGLVAAVGTDLKSVITTIQDRLKIFGYSSTDIIKISRDVIEKIAEVHEPADGTEQYKRISALMTAGDDARKDSDENSILALGVAAQISKDRPQNAGEVAGGLRPRAAYIIDSLKHPAEVAMLREIYPESFYLIGVHADDTRRREVLMEEKRMTKDEADRLMKRDAKEDIPHGQRTSDTFHMSDYFVRFDDSYDKLKQDLWRFLNIIFGDPFATPLFDEFAMFMAFSAALRSADLSRQVGAVIAYREEILSTGANDCPRFGGGLYWPSYDPETGKYGDFEKGRDYTRGRDSNKAEQCEMIEEIIKNSHENVKDINLLRDTLRRSRIDDLTEFGRVVHAEMEAILSCARNSISCRGATLYGTTFPCHNCAKHIIASGITRVVFVEPYAKSKAVEFHDDSLVVGFSSRKDVVHFEPFVGVGPRRFFDLFSMRLSSGYPIKRKDDSGEKTQWSPESSKLRLQLMPLSYLELEKLATYTFDDYLTGRGADHVGGE